MERKAFLIELDRDKIEEAEEKLKMLAPRIREEAAAKGIGNFSLWGVSNLMGGYEEYQRDARLATLESAVAGCGRVLCAPGTMQLMYHDLGVIRQDKSQIRHRVFFTKLKSGCFDEYKRRHDALIAARNGIVVDGPDNNFTIWHGAGYIFGYCEKVKAYDHEMTEGERREIINWETRQLEIMDWLTDDVDWITGEKHGPVRRIL